MPISKIRVNSIVILLELKVILYYKQYDIILEIIINNYETLIIRHYVNIFILWITL